MQRVIHLILNLYAVSITLDCSMSMEAYYMGEPQTLSYELKNSTKVCIETGLINVDILGYVTADKIDFEVEDLVDKNYLS